MSLTGSAIIDLPTLFVGVVTLLLLWGVVREAVAMAASAARAAARWAEGTQPGDRDPRKD